MNLQNLWFVLIVVLWSGYFLLEGFDFGVGMLLPFLPRDDDERGAMFESIGPVWDGNEVWLVTAGGATFAAFPAWYATMFSGLYLALLAVLFFLIIRVISFEWRTKVKSERWRAYARTIPVMVVESASGSTRRGKSCQDWMMIWSGGPPRAASTSSACASVSREKVASERFIGDPS